MRTIAIARLAFVFCGAAFSAAAMPPADAAKASLPAFVMRIDDNHTPEQWEAVCSIFEKHGFHCSLAVVSARLSEAQGACLKGLAARGHEIMDHTPNHSIISMTCPDAAAFERVRRLTFVHDSDAVGRKVLFNCAADDSHPYNRTIRAKVTAGRLVVAKGHRKRLGNMYSFVKLPTRKDVFGLKAGEGGFILHDFWGRKIATPFDMDENDVIVYDKCAFRIDDGAVRELAKATRERFDHFGIPPPKSWVAPGGWFPWVPQEQLERIYGREFGYKAGASGIGDKKPRECRWSMRYSAMHYFDQGASITPEEIIDRIEKSFFSGTDYILLSHMGTRKLPGKFPEYLEKTERFVQLLVDRKIRVLTLAELIEERFGKNSDKPQ